YDISDVPPVAGVVGLDHEEPAGDERAMDEREELWRDQPAVHLDRVVIGLRVIAMNLGDGAGFDVFGKKFAAAADGELEVRQAALVAAAAGVANDDRERVDAEVVVAQPADGAGEHVPTVAAADIEDDGGVAAEERRPVDAAIGIALKGGLRPLLAGPDGAGEPHA